MLYTGMGQEMLRVLMPFIRTKSQSMKLPIAPESKSVLTESRLGNLFSHFGFQGCAVLSGAEGERGGVSIGSQISVLTSSMSNTANLLTSSDQGTLFTGCAKQNPPPGLNKPPLLLLDLSGPLNLQSIPPSALQLTSGRPNSGGSPSQDGWPLCTDSNLAEVRSTFSGLHLCLWVFRQMVQAEAEVVLAERKAELLEESRVQRKGLVRQGRSVQELRSSTGV